MADHEKTYAVTAAVVTAAVLLVRWRATARHRGGYRYDPGKKGAWHRIRIANAWYHAWYGDTDDGSQACPSTADDPKAQPVVRHAEQLLEEYWSELKPLYPSQREYPEH